jgi:hypothetical protein
LKGNHARYSTRNAFTARTKQYGLHAVLFGVRRLHLSAASTIYAASIAACFIARYERPGIASYLHNSRTMISLSAIAVQSKWFENSGAIGISIAA